MTLPLDPAIPRRLLLQGQGMLEDCHQKAGPARVHKRIEALGFVQVDSIPVVARAHDHILWTRLQGYRPKMLKKLIEKDRRLFEHWTHDASVLPASSLPYWRVRFARYRDNPRHGQWWRERLGADFEAICERLMQRVLEEGSLRSRQLEDEEGTSSAWWGWKREKACLEYLWRIGRLGISARVNFEKVYESMAEIHPQQGEPIIDEDDYRDWCCRQAIEGLGMATHSEIAAHLRGISLAEARAWCKEELGAGRLEEVMVGSMDGSKPRRLVAAPDWKRRARVAERRLSAQGEDELRILSPFDPILRDRKRALRLFGFDYRFEAFVPAPKRRYGYYVLPLLKGERLVGRLDAKMHRNHALLEVKGIWWEPGHGGRKAPLRALKAALSTYCDFLEAETYRLPGVDLRTCRA